MHLGINILSCATDTLFQNTVFTVFECNIEIQPSVELDKFLSLFPKFYEIKVNRCNYSIRTCDCKAYYIVL